MSRLPASQRHKWHQQRCSSEKHRPGHHGQIDVKSIEKVQTDNGAEFQSSIHLHVPDQGIGQPASAPPRLYGKV